MDYDTDQILKNIEENGYAVDYGHLIGGPFIPDGRVRIYSSDSTTVLGEGETLEDAYSRACWDYNWKRI